MIQILNYGLLGLNNRSIKLYKTMLITYLRQINYAIVAAYNFRYAEFICNGMRNQVIIIVGINPSCNIQLLFCIIHTARMSVVDCFEFYTKFNNCAIIGFILTNFANISYNHISAPKRIGIIY